MECLLTSYQDILFNILELFTILLASSIESWKTSSFYITFFSIALKVFQSGFLDSIFFLLASIRQSLLNSEDMVCIECLVVHFFYRYDNYQRPSYLHVIHFCVCDPSTNSFSESSQPLPNFLMDFRT